MASPAAAEGACALIERGNDGSPWIDIHHLPDADRLAYSEGVRVHRTLVGRNRFAVDDTVAWKPTSRLMKAILCLPPQPETPSFPARIQADQDAFVTLPPSPAGRLNSLPPGFLASGAGFSGAFLSRGCALALTTV